MDCVKAEAVLKALGSVLEYQDREPLDIVICGAMVLLMRDISRTALMMQHALRPTSLSTYRQRAAWVAFIRQRSIVRRPTRDIDGLGFVEESNGEMVLMKPGLSARMSEAIERVGNLYGEGRHWLSMAATVLHDDTSLPPGIIGECGVK